MGKAVHPAFLPVADAKGVNTGQVAGMPGVKEAALDSGMQRGCLDQPAAAAGQPDHRVILDQRGGFIRG